jgi:hypothetical protein
VRRTKTTTAAAAGPVFTTDGRAGRRDDNNDETSAASQPLPSAQAQQRGRVRLNASVLGLYQKNHPTGPQRSSLSPLLLSAVRSGGDDSSGPRPGVGAATLRAERVRFKMR